MNITTKTEGAPLNFFNFDLKKLVMMGIILSLPLISINMQQKSHNSNWLPKPFALLASSIGNLYYSFSHGVTDTTALYVDLINIKKQSADTLLRNTELESRLERMAELDLENNRLRALLGFKETNKMTLIAAQIIGRDLLIDHSTVSLNKGTNDGVKDGMAVITTQGVLGYIYKADGASSHVMLLTDRYSVVDALVQRTRSHGLVEGKNQSSSTLTLKYVENAEDIRVGDLIVTGGLDNIFPKGFPIAVVSDVVAKNFAVSVKVDLKPVVDPYKAEEVFIIASAANLDMTAQFLPTPPPADPATTPTEEKR